MHLRTMQLLRVCDLFLLWTSHPPHGAEAVKAQDLTKWFCVSVCMCVCMHVFICVFVHVCMYVYVEISQRTLR